MNNRIRYIAKGAAILLMILGHVVNLSKDLSICSLIYSSVYLHHISLFFIISGYFIKVDKHIKQNCVKSFKTLVIPYIVMGAMCV